MRKNPNNNPLRIVKKTKNRSDKYIHMLGQLAIAEALLVRAGKDSAMPHFIAIVKELEDYFDFKFEQIQE